MSEEADLEERLPLSALLLTLDAVPTPVTLAAVVEHFGGRAFGGIPFVFAIPNLLPLPPGSSTLLGLPLLVIAPQLAFGARSPWLPRWLAMRTMDRGALAALAAAPHRWSSARSG